jgi:hypothetical protein
MNPNKFSPGDCMFFKPIYSVELLRKTALPFAGDVFECLITYGDETKETKRFTGQQLVMFRLWSWTLGKDLLPE